MHVDHIIKEHSYVLDHKKKTENHLWQQLKISRIYLFYNDNYMMVIND